MVRKLIELAAERRKRGLPLDDWRRGIYALLVTRPKSGVVKAFRRKKRDR